MMKTSIDFTRFARRVGTLTLCTAALALAGCSAVAPQYQATNDNVRSLIKLPSSKVSIGEFTTKSPDLNRLSIRAGSFNSPYNNSYAEFLKAALRNELESADKLDAKAPVVISGELLTNTLDAGSDKGNAHVSARIVVKRGADVVFDKVIRGDNEWDSSFAGAIAIPMARMQYGDTVKKLIANLVADLEFRNVLASGSDWRQANVATSSVPTYTPTEVSTQSFNQQPTKPPVTIEKKVPASSPVTPAPVAPVQSYSMQDTPVAPTTRSVPVQAAAVVSQPVSAGEIKLGVSSNTVERLGRQSGCNSTKGAALVSETGPVENYKMICDDGKVYLAHCEYRQCSLMQYQ